MGNNRKTGILGENYAKQHLVDSGYEIISTNYRCRAGEIDIIAKKEEFIVFLEVKYRKSLLYGYPRESVNAKKQSRIRDVAIFYIVAEDILNLDFRFDVIEILQVAQGEIKIEHIKNAF